MTQQQIRHSFVGDTCQLRLLLDRPNLANGKKQNSLQEASEVKRVENVRNCDIFVEDFYLLFYADVQLFQFHSPRHLDVKDMKHLVIRYNSTDRYYYLELPCFPRSTSEMIADKIQLEKVDPEKHATESNTLDLWKLKRITDNCKLQMDDHAELLQFVANFDYGFAGRFKGKIISGESDMEQITRVPEPYLSSPLQRSIDREVDELKNFSREQYKLNLVELQIPEGHENPMKMDINFNACNLTKDEEHLLHNLTRKTAEAFMPSTYDRSEVDCGLISVLLAICYDVRFTNNDPTCESGWTRSILSAALTYFEPFECLQDVVISFLRRSVIYPLYRNLDLGRQCVQDAIDALQKAPNWIIKQLLVTHEVFLTSEHSREALNRYFIEDYIRYVTDETICSRNHLQMLARNLRNVLPDVNKKHLKLELIDIEMELLKELVGDMNTRSNTSGVQYESSTEEDDDDDDDDDDDNDCEGDDDDGGTESGEDEGEISSGSENEDNCVIEQNVDASII